MSLRHRIGQDVPEQEQHSQQVDGTENFAVSVEAGRGGASGSDDADGARAGAESSIRAPTNSHGTCSNGESQSSRPRTSGGIDWLGLTVEGEFRPEAWEKIGPRLANAREASQQGDEAGAFLDVGLGQPLQVDARSWGKGFAHCDFWLRFGGIHLHVGDPRRSRSWLIHIDVPGRVWLLLDGKDVRRLLAKVVRALGYSPKSWNVSRVDLAADIAELHPSTLNSHYLRNCAVCRAQSTSHRAYGGRRVHGWQIGSRMMMRVYDKALKLRVEKDYDGLRLMAMYRWGCYPEVSTRVEFQIRGDELRDRHRIHTWDDLDSKLADLARWCCEDWFRLTTVPPDRSHTSRADTAPEWWIVQQAFESWTGSVNARRSPRRKFAPSMLQIQQQMQGWTTSMFALKGRVPDCVEDVGLQVMELLRPSFDEICHRVGLKIDRFKAERAEVGLPAIVGE